jgi:hypothetical protein
MAARFQVVIFDDALVEDARAAPLDRGQKKILRVRVRVLAARRETGVRWRGAVGGSGAVRA